MLSKLVVSGRFIMTCTSSNLQNRGKFIMTDVTFYTRLRPGVDDIDFTESQENRRWLSEAGIDVHDGFNVFKKTKKSYINVVDDNMQPGLTLTIGLYIGTDSAETTMEQRRRFGNNMGRFHAKAIASLDKDFPNVPMIFITNTQYSFVAETYMCKDLTRLPVMITNRGCNITNVRYGDNSSTRYYDGPQFATCINIPFNTLRQYVDVVNGELDIWKLTRDVKDSGKNVLVLASNRFANNVELVRFSRIPHNEPNMWNLPAVPMLPNPEKRYVELNFGPVWGGWNGITTFSELMDNEDCPLTLAQRVIAWVHGIVQ